MPINKRQVGADKEMLAARLLVDKGYKIISQNFRAAGAEIDIIARHTSVLVFVEVKYRKTGHMGMPFEAVNSQKIIRLGRAAMRFLVSHPEYADLQKRFDIISINGSRISHIENAFELPDGGYISI